MNLKRVRKECESYLVTIRKGMRMIRKGIG